MNGRASNPSEVRDSGLGNVDDICEALKARFAGKLFDVMVRADDNETRMLEQGEMFTAGSLPVYDIGCIQTLVDGLVMHALAGRGEIALDAPVGLYLPELNAAGFRPGLRICVKHLLAHATGYHASDGVPERAGYRTWDELVQYLTYTAPSFPAGAICSWNGLGKSILTQLVERVVGIRYDEAVRREIGAMIGLEPRILNMESGWPTFVVGIDDLVAYVDVALNSPDFAAVLYRSMVPVVRNPVASRSTNPVAYALGLALYPEGLWGQSGNGAQYSLGIRFDLERSFCAALSIGAPPFARDLALRYLSAARRFTRPNYKDHVIGSILGCELSDIQGRYYGDDGDAINVTVTKFDVACAYFRREAHVATLLLSARDDGILVSDGRWDAHQIEFYRLPESNQIILTLGQIAYAKRESSS